MKTNFFELVAGLSISGNLQINIHQNESGTQTVSVMLFAKDPKSTAGKTLPPMLLKGSPQELDEAFFRYITEPVKQIEKVFANAEAYQKELDKAKKQATTDKDKKATADTPVAPKAADSNLFSSQPEEQPGNDDFEEPLDEHPDDNERLAEKLHLYDEAMQRVNTLNGQMKYAEAIAQLPDPEEYPDKVEEIKNKGEALLKRQELYASLQQEV
ncbi:MAG TPA: PRTRC system protein E [Mucilaginibacter sp.]|nr:PRTRC system protein E [Mucilaginibacter sp.]